MGVSTDALLVYGYVWDDEVDLFGTEDEEADDDLEWSEIIARQRGIPNPWDAYPQEFEHLPYTERRAKGDEWVAAHDAELDAWRAARKAIEDEYGVEIDQHGSDQWSCPVVKVAGAGHRAYRGDVHAVEAADLNINPEWRTKLQRFVDDLGIDVNEAAGPGWFLLSWWG